MEFVRTLRHLVATRWSVRRRFPPSALVAIEAAIGRVEGQHAGEIRFAIEAYLDLPELWQDVSARQRALQVFGHLGVWDTEGNNGVLVFVLNAERDVEIVADRGIASRVQQLEWDAICREMEQHFQAGRFEQGSIAGVEAIGRLLGRHFPPSGSRRNELPNQVRLL